jgi:arginine kinase
MNNADNKIVLVTDDYHSARRRLDDPDVLTTLERCYRLIHDKRANILDQTVSSRNGSFPGSASSLRTSVTSYLAKFLKRAVFEKIKFRQTRLDHNLFDVIWPAMKKSTFERRIDEDLNAGVVAPDFDVYVVFQEFFVPLIKDIHGLSQKDNFKEHPTMEFFPMRVDEKSSPAFSSAHRNHETHWNLDSNGKWVVSAMIECSRNLEEFELPLNLTIGKIEQCERVLTEKLLSKEFANAINETGLGQYYTMNEVLENSSDIKTILAANGLLIPLLDHSDAEQLPESQAVNGAFYPYGRGVYVSASRTLVAWVNVQEHLRVLSCTPLSNVGDIGIAYSKLARAMMFLNRYFNFRHSFFLGYLASRPSFLGTSLRFNVTLDIPHLRKDLENLRQLCLIRGLHMKTRFNYDSIVVSNSHCMNTTEWKLLHEFCSAVENILKLESEKSNSNSMHIASMMLKIFRKKKNSLASE